MSKTLTIAIEGDELVIRAPVSLLANAVTYDPQLQLYDDDLDESFSPEVTDENKWASEICRSLEREEEDGATLVHRMLDKAAINALECGAEGIDTADYLRDRARAARAFPPETDVLPETSP